MYLRVIYSYENAFVSGIYGDTFLKIQLESISKNSYKVPNDIWERIDKIAAASVPETLYFIREKEKSIYFVGNYFTNEIGEKVHGEKNRGNLEIELNRQTKRWRFKKHSCSDRFLEKIHFSIFL